MGKRFATFAVLAICLAVPAMAPAGVTPEITVNDNFFDPVEPATGAGGFTFFHWSRAVASTGQHNVRQDAKLFRSGEPTTGAIDFTVAASAGSFPYYCEIHGGPNGEGMHGVIRVRPGLSDVTSDSFFVAWAGGLTTTGDAFDVRYRVNGGDWKTWKNDTEKRNATFGHNDNPVDVKPGKTYEIEVRSEKSVSKPSKRSDWSPLQSVTIL
jgi:plastocyanin